MKEGRSLKFIMFNGYALQSECLRGELSLSTLARFLVQIIPCSLLTSDAQYTGIERNRGVNRKYRGVIRVGIR